MKFNKKKKVIKLSRQQRIEKMAKEIQREKKKLFRMRIEKIKLEKMRRKYEAMSPPEKLTFNLRDMYFSNLNSDQLSMIENFSKAVYEKAMDAFNEKLKIFEDKFNRLYDRVSAQITLNLGDKFMRVKIPDMNVDKLNDLGSRGWRIAFTFEDNIYFYRNIKVKK